MSDPEQLPEDAETAPTATAEVEPTTQNEESQPKSQVSIDETDEYLSSKDKFDLIGLHGFHSPSEGWDSEKESSWLKSLVVTKSWQARIVRYGWDAADLVEGLYTRQAIRREAHKLLVKLKELRKGQETPLPLVFFAHDIGGIIVKEALVLAGQCGNEYADIRCSTRVLMFFGCPHRSNSVNHMETNIAGFLFAGDEPKGDAQDAKCFANSIIAVNNSFLQTRMITRAIIISCFSAMDKIREQLFDISTTTLRTPSEWAWEINLPHKELTQEPKGNGLYDGISRLLDRAAFPWRRDGISPFIHVFESQAVPVYQLKPLQDLTHRFDWLGEDKTFKDWQAHQQTHFLHIHGSPNISEAAEYAFGVLDEARVLDTRDDMIFNKIMYFKFDRHDIRRNSVGAMANTFLSQILSRFRTTPSSLIKDFEPPDFSDCWTDKDAFIFLDKIRRCLGYRGQVNWILDGLDQCDESGHWLLSEILGVAARSEQLFKVIITSVDDKYICDALSEFPEIDLRKHRTVQPTGETHPGSEFALWAEVLQDRPKLGLMESKIRELLHSCGDDDQLRRLLLEWLRGSRFASGRAVEKEIQFLTPPSPKKLIQRLLESVKEDRRPWARKLIMWVMHAVRPLTPAELEIALVVNEASDESTVDLNASLDIMEEIKDCFGPLFVVENGEVHLGHPATREIFSPENTASDDHRPWYVLHDPREGHREIVTVCLYYLTLPGVQNRMVIACKASPNTQPILEGKSDILSYAIQFWPQHYRLGYVTSSTGDVSKAFSRFLDDKALQRWAGANWYFSNPHIRSDKSFLSPLPIIASLGLEALVIDLIKSMNQKEKDKIVPFALTEAAQNGHRTVVQSLMKASEIGESGYLEATVVAARSGQFDILADLLKHVWAEFKDIKLPSIITSRMAFFGADALLDAHLKAGADANPPAQSDYAPPIYVAAMRNNLTAVDVLLKQGANPDVSNTNWKDCLPIIAAAKNGHSSMVKKLVDAGASVEGKDAEGKPSLWWASFLGQHKAVQALIDAKANRSSVEVSLTEKLDWPIFISTAGSAFMKCNRALLAYGVNPNIPTTKGYPKYALGWAASQGHAEMCRQLIEEGGANVDGADDDKPIIHAARSGEREVIDLFIEKGANLDAMVDNDTLASTALITAVELNFVDLAKRLIEKNATVDLALSSGVTALYHAVYKGFVETVKVLIAAGGDLKTVAYTKKWGLVHIGYRRVECLKVLLDAGADINAVCKDGTALYLAAFNGHVETARLLISRGADTEIPCQAQEFWDDGHTPLPTAAALGHIEIVRALLEGGANPKTKTPRGATPLILAVANDKEDCVKALLEYDADLEAVDVDNDTALHAVEVSTPLSITKLLVNRGANIEHRGRQNYTFLGRAVASNIPDVVKYLLEKKATINVVGGYRGGPLHMAAYRGDIEILKLLIQHGGDINLGDPNLCGTPLQSALYPSNQIEDETTRTTIVRYIIEDASADVNAHAGLFGSALNVACLGNTVDHISLILENGADPGWADTYGRQPIHYASFKTIDHVQLLVDAGADVTAKNKIGQTALHIAGVTGRIDLVEIILSKARNLLNEPDVDGWTPLMWACRLCDKWNTPASLEPAIIQLLISEGADLWAKGKSEDREWSPLKLARYHGASEGVVKLLTPAVKSRIGKGGKEEVWDVKFHTSRRGPRTPGYCDVCLFGIYGIVHACIECVEPFYICFKCSSRRKEFHSQHDKWEVRGTEFTADEEEEEAKVEDTSEHETGLVEQVQDDDDEGDWSDGEDKEKGDEDDD